MDRQVGDGLPNGSTRWPSYRLNLKDHYVRLLYRQRKSDSPTYGPPVQEDSPQKGNLTLPARDGPLVNDQQETHLVTQVGLAL